MNILIFAHDSSMYGASQSLLTFLLGLAQKQDRKLLVLLPYKGDIEEHLVKNSIEYKIILFPRCVTEINNDFFWRVLKASYNYKKKVKSLFGDFNQIVHSFQPDVIYTNTSVVSVGYYLSKKNRIPHVWHIREFSNFYDFKYLPNLKTIKRQLLQSKKVIFGSASLLNHWMKTSQNNSVVIYNGVQESDKISFPGNKKSNLNPHRRLGIIGAITKGKGQHLAIEALADVHQKYPETTLAIYGDIVDENYFRFLSSLLKKFSLFDKVIFKGFVKSKDEMYNDLDVLLSCSHMEGFGRTIVEAMGYGIPVIANASGGVLEIIEDKTNGLLFDGTVDGLVAAIYQLDDSTLFQSLSLNGFNQARINFSPERYIEQIDQILIEAIKRED